MPHPPRDKFHQRPRRELGQHFLRDRRVAAEVCGLLGASAAPVVDLGAGDGMLTAELVRTGREVTAVEIDPRLARILRTRFGSAVRVVRADVLQFCYPAAQYEVVSNVPYAITTALLRSLFAHDGWCRAALVMQWEVARKRSGATMLTASWWPWYEIELVRRVPAQAFRPAPRVDGGLVLASRRREPFLGAADRRGYQRLVRAVFTGKGAGLFGILRPYVPRGELRGWARRHAVDLSALPRDLTAAQWVSLYRLVSGPQPTMFG